MTKLFFDIADTIDAVISKKTPSKEEQDYILSLIKEEKYARYFFKKLDNPFWFKVLKAKGYFEVCPGIVKIDSTYYRIPYWHVLDYLEKMSEYPNFVDELIDIMKTITKSQVDNWHVYRSFLRMARKFPPEKAAEIVPFVKQWLENKQDNLLQSYEVNGLLEYLLEKEQKEASIKLIEFATSVWRKERIIVGEKEATAESIMDKGTLEELIKTNLHSMIEKYPKEIISVVTRNLEKAIRIEYENCEKDDHSYIWRPAIEEHSQNMKLHDMKEILTIFLRDILNGTAKEESDIENILERFLNHKIPIFKRLALHTLTEYKQKFDKLISSKMFPNEETVIKLMNDDNLRHELYRFIDLHFNDLTETQKKLIFAAILKGPILPNLEFSTEEKQNYRNKWKLEWLEVLKDKEFEPARKLYSELSGKIKFKPEHPDFISYSESFVGSVSPLSVEEILSKTTKEVVVYLKTFKEKSNWIKEPSKRALAQTLGYAIRKNPKKFEEKLEQFLDVPFDYTSEILLTFERLWQEKKGINWYRILEFCKNLVSSDRFWQNEERGRARVTSAISDLIEAGTRNDENAFESNLSSIARDVLIVIAKKETVSHDYTSDPSSSVLNSPKGKVFLALISYALRKARLDYKGNKEYPEKWEKEVKDIFTDELTNPKRTYEIHTVCGQFFPQLRYLDRKWVGEHLKDIFPKEDEKFWLAAFGGYLAISFLSKEVYELVREEYRKAIGMKIDFIYSERTLAQHLTLAYLNEWEDLESEGSIFKQYVDRASEQQIIECINYLRPEKRLEKYKDKIISFWEYRFDKIANKLESHKKELSNFIKLAGYLDVKETDVKTGNMLEASIKFAAYSNNTDRVIEFFAQRCQINPLLIAGLFNELLDNCEVPPRYSPEEIKQVIETLYQTPNRRVKELTHKIVNKYGEKGVEEIKGINFRDLYKKYKEENHTAGHSQVCEN